MKTLLLITTFLAAGSLTMPLHAQSPSPSSTATPPSASTTEKAGKLHFAGTLSAIDTPANTITVSNKKQGERTFQATGTTKIMKDGAAATLSDAKAGDHVHGAYTKSADGKMTLLTLKIGLSKKKAAKSQ